MATVEDYRCTIGIMLFGNSGGNVGEDIINEIGPQGRADVKLFVANTSARGIKRFFGDGNNEKLKLWVEKGALSKCYLGGVAVTKGRGAGGDPALGRQAAETEESIKEMAAFIDSVDQVFIGGALGGGTGTGAIPVAARLCKELKKTAVALIIIPEPEEGLDMHVRPAMAEIRKHVPAAAIHNAYLMEYLDALPIGERDVLTTKEVWRVLNQKSMVRMILFLLEILQETGLEEFDEADWNMILRFGKHFFFGIAEYQAAEIVGTSAEDIVAKLFIAEFLDRGVAERGEVFALWFHGPWPHQKTREVRNLIKKRMSEKRRKGESEIQIHLGRLEEVQDGKLWVSLITVAKDLCDDDSRSAFVPPEFVLHLDEVVRPEIQYDLSLDLDATSPPASIPATVTRRIPGVGRNVPRVDPILVTMGGKQTTIGVVPHLAERYKQLISRGKDTTDREWKALIEEISPGNKMELSWPAEKTH